MPLPSKSSTATDTMINKISGTAKHAIAIEIVDGYRHEDEKNLESMFEELLDKGVEKVNILVKIDKLSFIKSSFKAMWEDGIYALKHLRYCGRIAVVGDSKIEELLVKADNAVFGSSKAGRIEKYFPISEMDKALAWVNEN